MPESANTPTPADIAPTTTDDDGANGAAPATPDPSSRRLPDDHPLVTAYARQKAENEELKDKARRLDEIEEAAKSEAQKQAEALAAAQSRLTKYEQRDQVAAWAAEITKDSHVPAGALRGATREELQAHHDSLAPLIPKPSSDPEPTRRPALGPYVPSEGSEPSGNLGGTAQAFADAVDKFLN